MPQLGPYNILNCRSMSILSLNGGSSSTNGMVIAMDIKPLDTTTPSQTIFSIRDSTNNKVTLAFTFQPPSGTNLAANYGSGWNLISAGPTLTPSNSLLCTHSLDNLNQ